MVSNKGVCVRVSRPDLACADCGGWRACGDSHRPPGDAQSAPHAATCWLCTQYAAGNCIFSIKPEFVDSDSINFITRVIMMPGVSTALVRLGLGGRAYGRRDGRGWRPGWGQKVWIEGEGFYCEAMVGWL